MKLEQGLGFSGKFGDLPSSLGAGGWPIQARLWLGGAVQENPLQRNDSSEKRLNELWITVPLITMSETPMKSTTLAMAILGGTHF